MWYGLKNICILSLEQIVCHEVILWIINPHLWNKAPHSIWGENNLLPVSESDEVFKCTGKVTDLCSHDGDNVFLHSHITGEAHQQFMASQLIFSCFCSPPKQVHNNNTEKQDIDAALLGVCWDMVKCCNSQLLSLKNEPVFLSGSDVMKEACRMS